MNPRWRYTSSHWYYRPDESIQIIRRRSWRRDGTHVFWLHKDNAAHGTFATKEEAMAAGERLAAG